MSTLINLRLWARGAEKTVLAAYRTYRARRAHHTIVLSLETMEDHLLKDIGVNRVGGLLLSTRSEV